MDAKITKIRFTRMLSYDWLKIVAGVLVAVLFWSLLFTMTATRITPAQKFTVYNYTGNTALSNSFFTSYNKAFTNGVFSAEVIETNETDLTTSKDIVNTLLEAHLGTDEGDVIFVADIPDPSTEYTEEGETKYQYSYLETFVGRWYRYLYSLDREKENSFFCEMEKYLNGFYTEGYENADSLNEAAVEEAFRTRITKNKDKRYKKEEQIQQGIQNDIERIKKYRNALVNFYSYLDAGYVSFTTVEVTLTGYDDQEYQLKDVYGLNLCPNVATMDGLKEVVCYQTSYKDENGAEKIKVTAENMHVLFFDLPGMEEGFAYESLLYVNYLIESYCTALQ